jgi:hypothetical protein
MSIAGSRPLMVSMEDYRDYRWYRESGVVRGSQSIMIVLWLRFLPLAQE